MSPYLFFSRPTEHLPLVIKLCALTSIFFCSSFVPAKFNWYTWFAVVLISKAGIISPENPHPAGMKTVTLELY